MKRYRWTNLFIDTTRNIIKEPNSPDDIKKQFKNGIFNYIALNHGSETLIEKYERWLSLDPPDLCVPIEYHNLMREVEFSYVRGDSYPALTSACCLGERILNHLVFGLKEYFKGSVRYKEVAMKESIQDWEKAISILYDWGIISEPQVKDFKDLLSLRNPAVHYGDINERSTQAYRALNLIYAVTKSLFGYRINKYFWAPGETYIKKELESDPFVKVFLLPHCVSVGYNHEVKNIEGGTMTIYDPGPYPEGKLTDEEFLERRKTWRQNDYK